MRTCSRSNASSQHVPNMLDWIQVRRARWPFHMQYCSSFKHVLHKTSWMRSGIIMLENKEISITCQCNVCYEVFVSCLHTLGPSKYHSDWYASPYVHLYWFHPIPSNQLVCILTFQEQMRCYLEFPFASIPKHVRFWHGSRQVYIHLLI